jgi:AcrR family transcriptional regulator
MRNDREDAIVAAAYGLLERQGFAATTMQAVAREAHASMETLYRWYGDKTGLFRSLITRNTDEVAATLERSLAQGQTGLQRLADAGPALLSMLVGPRAVALNRAAASDATGSLGQTLAEGGRGTLFPRLVAVMQQAVAEGALTGEPADTLTDLWLTLLIGDLQIRRVTGALPPLAPQDITRRADRALQTLCRLYAAAPQP